MEALLYKITLWSFFAGMMAHFIGLYPKESSSGSRKLLFLTVFLTAIGFASLTTTLVTRWIAQARVPISSSYEYLSVLAWFVAIFYFIVLYKARSTFLGACISPGLYLAIVFAGLYPQRLEMTLVPALQSYWLKIHVSLTIIGEAIFAVSFVAGILYLLKNCRWDSVGASVKNKSLALLAGTLAAGMLVVLVLKSSGLVLGGVSGLKAFMGLLVGGFLLAVPVYVILWKKWVGAETANFGGLVLALSILSLMISGMILGSQLNRNSQRLDNLMYGIRAVDELSELAGSEESALSQPAYADFIRKKNASLGLYASLEARQAELKHPLSQADAADLLAGSALAGELTFPLSLGEIREERYNLTENISHLEEIANRTGLPVQNSTLHTLRNSLINDYNRYFSGDFLPPESGRNVAFIGYMLVLGVPFFSLFYYLARRIQSRVPELEALDSLAYRTVSLGYPIFTFGALIAGAVWAHYAWGKWWSNDPKEIGSLLVWLTFTIYLHARYVRIWSGNQAAMAAIVGFLFAVLSFVGNSVLGGLHSYG